MRDTQRLRMTLLLVLMGLTSGGLLCSWPPADAQTGCQGALTGGGGPRLAERCRLVDAIAGGGGRAESSSYVLLGGGGLFVATWPSLSHRFEPGLSLVAVPCDPIEPDAQAVFGTESVAWWDPDESPPYALYPDPRTDVRVGRGYWVRHEETMTRTIGVRRSAPSADFSETIPAGWWLLGNPFAEPVRWDSIQSDPADGILRFGWIYGSGTGYKLVLPWTGLDVLTTLEAWQGAWIKAREQCTVTVPRPSTVLRGVSGEGTGRLDLPPGGWVVRLTAQAGELADEDNFLGVLPPRRDDPMAYHIENPPVMSPYVDLYFTWPGRATDGTCYAVDLRESATRDAAWEFNVATDLQDTEVTIGYPDLRQLPKGYAPTLVDLDSGKRTYMRTTTGYSYNSGSAPGVRHFRVELGSSGGTLVITELSVTSTRGEGVSIAYRLTRAAQVEVSILNIAGRVVRVLQEDVGRSAGESTVTWDGHNAEGNLVPNGTYLVQVAARSEDGQAASAVRTVTLAR